MPPSDEYAAYPSPDDQAKTSGLAIGSLVTGVFGFLVVTPLIAIVLGCVALSQIGKSEGRIKGKGLAIGGIAAGAVWMVLAVPALLIAMLLPALSAARMQARSAVDMSNLRQIGQGMFIYATDNNGQIGHASELLPYLGNDPSFLASGFPSDRKLQDDRVDEEDNTYAMGGYYFVWNNRRVTHMSSPSQIIMAFSRHVADEQRSRSVLYGDGSVLSVKEFEFRELLEQQNVLRKRDKLPLIDLSEIDFQQ